MILLDGNVKCLFPYGLRGTPFEAVFDALQAVAGEVWAVPPAPWRAMCAWAYWLNKVGGEPLHTADPGFLAAASVSEAVPAVFAWQTDASKADVLAEWMMDYVPTKDRLEALFAAYGATVSVLPPTDPQSQEIYPLPAYPGPQLYIRIESGISVDDATTVAINALPMGVQVLAYSDTAATVTVPVSHAYGDGLFVVLPTSVIPFPTDTGGGYGRFGSAPSDIPTGTIPGTRGARSPAHLTQAPSPETGLISED